jgi:NAD-dependent SIR2 family protein deacetylase
MTSTVQPPPSHTIDELVALLRGRSVAVLTGAGCSTESGIPDYRGPETQRRARNPIQWSAYVADPHTRARYWARSLVGWPRVASAQPNSAHHALATLERDGIVNGLITQNVDRLHHAAGTQRVIELHGALADVVCMNCGRVESRASLQARMLALNPSWARSDKAEFAPDGDAEIPAEALTEFRVAPCLACDRQTLKPDVVFFGENVPRAKVDAAFELVDQADALLVVGSSLAVYSGLRFVRHAAKRALPVAIVNLGATRGDEHAQVRIEARAGDVLTQLARRIGG